jgi:hypothetical protein
MPCPYIHFHHVGTNVETPNRASAVYIQHLIYAEADYLRKLTAGQFVMMFLIAVLFHPRPKWNSVADKDYNRRK